MKEYIAVQEGFVGIDVTPEAAYEKLRKTLADEGWNAPDKDEITMYEVLRKGKPVVTIIWE